MEIVQLACIHELNNDRDAGNHGDILVGRGHHRGQHVVAEKQRPENHTASDARHSDQKTRDSSGKCQLHDVGNRVELRVMLIVIIAVSLFHSMNLVHQVNSLESQHQRAKDKRCVDAMPGGLGQLLTWICARLRQLLGKQEGQEVE